jgi:hypothetical protein
MTTITCTGPCWIAELKDSAARVIDRQHFDTLGEAMRFSRTNHNVPDGEAEQYQTQEPYSPEDDLRREGEWYHGKPKTLTYNLETDSPEEIMKGLMRVCR